MRTEQEHPMSDLRTEAPPVTREAPTRTVLRWLVSFAGFPLGGVAAMALTGPVDSLGPAVAGGLVSGAVLGAVQAWAMGPHRVNPVAWVVATAVGLMAGLGLGASLVDYRAGVGDLVLQGAVCGALVGLAQAVVLLPRLGGLALAWPVALSGIWAVAWATTTSIGVQVEDQFTVFGSSGAIVATLLTAVLPLALNSRHHTETSQS
jgi:hypothetical protein